MVDFNEALEADRMVRAMVRRQLEDFPHFDEGMATKMALRKACRKIRMLTEELKQQIRSTKEWEQVAMTLNQEITYLCDQRGQDGEGAA